jgi:hypothetical protein
LKVARQLADGRRGAEQSAWPVENEEVDNELSALSATAALSMNGFLPTLPDGLRNVAVAH